MPRSATSLLVLVVTAGLPRLACAQADTTLHPMRVGERVRVTLTAGSSSPVVGRVLRLERDTLHLRVHAESLVHLPIQDVVVVEGSRGVNDRITTTTHATVGGALIGLGVGTLFFGRAAFASGDRAYPDVAVGLIAAVGAVGAVMGAVAGTVSYPFTSPEHWVVLATPLPCTTLIPAPELEGPARVSADSAARVSAIPIGVRIRARRRTNAPDVIGLTERVADSLHLVVEDRGPRALAWSDIMSLERERESSLSGRSVVPVLGGALGGWLLGPITLSGMPFICTTTRCADRQQLNVIGAAIGIAVGAVWSRRQRSERWIPIPLPPP